MGNSEIRRKILEILYETARKQNGRYKNRHDLKTQLGLDDKDLDFHILYLYEKHYLEIVRAPRVNFQSAKITSRGIDLVEDNNRLNSIFPINITHNTVQNSPGTVINSSNVSINIHESFNKIYEQINDKTPENPEKVKEIIENIEKELEREEINKSKLQKSFDWLKNNANWSIPSLIKIVTMALTGIGLIK